MRQLEVPLGTRQQANRRQGEQNPGARDIVAGAKSRGRRFALENAGRQRLTLIGLTPNARQISDYSTLPLI